MMKKIIMSDISTSSDDMEESDKKEEPEFVEEIS